MNFKYYNTNRLILLIIALVIIFGSLSTYLHNWLLKTPDPVKSLIFFTDSFTVPFFIAIFLFFVNNKWWRSKIFSWLVEVPNLNGRYVGKLESSYMENDQPKIIDCVFEIKQTASYIHISGYFGDINNKFVSSSSKSNSETIIKELNGFFRIDYIFSNETGGLSEKLNDHSGTSRFLYFPDQKMLEGEYYNKRKNTGIIKVTFEQKILRGRLFK